MNPIKQFIEESEKEFDEKFDIEPSDRDYKNMMDIKSFLLSQQLALLNVVKGVIEKRKPDERKVAEFGDYQAETYDEKMLVRSVLDDILKELTSLTMKKKKQKCLNCGRIMTNVIDSITGKRSEYLWKCSCNPTKIISIG